MARKISADDIIEARDTVRFIGRSARWIVEDIDGDTLEISYFRKLNRRDSRCIIRTVGRAKVELVRKGNSDDDAAERFDRDMAAANGMTVEQYRAHLDEKYREAERRQVERDEAARVRAAREAAERVERAAAAAREAAEREAAERVERAAMAAREAEMSARYDAAMSANGGDVIAALLAMWA
jgi:hypothetical protein